jgi:hypothetical protein
LLAAKIFNNDVDKAFQQYASISDAANPSAPSIESIREHLPKFVAENLINNTSELPSHYTIHAFWKEFGHKFREKVSEFEAYKERQSFLALKNAGDALKQVSSNLLTDLQSQRQTLCREFDVPAARPVATPSSMENMF